ncbi:MAG TPA: lipid II flippase MurJ, partial [Rhabdaerophilum sp.]|nr:lipid II flippase MurJ [Rhabdaerophilum sp.]
MSLALPFTIVGSATLLSRVTGFLRDVLIAAMLGSGPVADIYVAAFLIPNLFRKMMSEGALRPPPSATLKRPSVIDSRSGTSMDESELISNSVL